MMRRRTCTSPEAIEIGQTSDDETHRRLFYNLEQSGWSPIFIDVAEHTAFFSALSADAQEVLQRQRHWKELHEEMFAVPPELKESTDESPVSGCRLTFISAESGSSDQGVVEAKQSWEFQSPSYDNHGVTPGVPDVRKHGAVVAREEVLHRMKAWSEILNAVAVTVRKTLKLPEHLVIRERDDGVESLDLLRAFSYDASAPTSGDEAECTPSTGAIGSSPHTDWGSFTIVWQDDTPDSCLQTFCHLHQKWNDVTICRSQTERSGSFLPLVVHVGDVLSLAIGSAMQDVQTCANVKYTTSSIETGLWPSPRHRVLAPVTQKRNSLVYFCYPPADTSDQSTATSKAPTGFLDSAERRFLECKDRSMQEILREKWAQVKR